MAEHVCPWWMGFLLASPIRRLWQKPETILASYIKTGMTVLEVGPGMGFFSLPMARMVGAGGKIICVDIQERMLKTLMRRARRAGVANWISTIIASPNSLNVNDYTGQVDFVLAFAVVHEVPNQENLFRDIYQSMKSGAQLLISEPTGHVTPESFERTLEVAMRFGFLKVSEPKIRHSISVVLRKRAVSG